MTLDTTPIPTVRVLGAVAPGPLTTTISVPGGRVALVETLTTLTLVMSTGDGTSCAELSDAGRDRLLDALYASRLRGLGVDL